MLTFISLKYAYGVGEMLLKAGAVAGLLLLLRPFSAEISALIAIAAMVFIIRKFILG